MPSFWNQPIKSYFSPFKTYVKRINVYVHSLHTMIATHGIHISKHSQGLLHTSSPFAVTETRGFSKQKIKPSLQKITSSQITIALVLASTVMLITVTCYSFQSLNKPLSPTAAHISQSAVLGAATVISFAPTVTPFPIRTKQPSDVLFIQTSLATTSGMQIKTGTLPQKSYSIAIIGDSMVDTMGERLEYLEHVLTKAYPSTNFQLYNYGIGGQNVEEGLARFSSPFHFRDRTYPPLPQVHPDILIVGSFAYNPFNPYDRNRHWLGLTQLVQEAKSSAGKVYVLAEIAPLLHDFGKGPGGVNWPDPEIHVGHIIEQLENAEGVAQEEHVGLIDAFAKSQINSAHEGNKAYVNPNDNIHPSIAGHEFMANLIANTIF